MHDPSSPAAPDNSPFISDVPADTAMRSWLDACAAAGCPERIGAVTVPEIATSIAAELIAVRRGIDPGKLAMKMADDELRKWLEKA